MGVAIARNGLGRRAEAEATLREVKAAFTRSLGATHWRTANAQYQLGLVLRDRGKRGEALAELRQAHAILLEEMGPGHQRTVDASEAIAALERASDAGVRTVR